MRVIERWQDFNIKSHALSAKKGLKLSHCSDQINIACENDLTRGHHDPHCCIHQSKVPHCLYEPRHALGSTKVSHPANCGSQRGVLGEQVDTGTNTHTHTCLERWTTGVSCTRSVMGSRHKLKVKVARTCIITPIWSHLMSLSIGQKWCLQQKHLAINTVRVWCTVIIS